MNNNAMTRWLLEIDAGLAAIEFNFDRLPPSRILKDIERYEVMLENIYRLLEYQDAAVSDYYGRFLSVKTRIEHIRLNIEFENPSLWKRIKRGVFGLLKSFAAIFGLRKLVPSIGMDKPLMLTFDLRDRSRY